MRIFSLLILCLSLACSRVSTRLTPEGPCVPTAAPVADSALALGSAVTAVYAGYRWNAVDDEKLLAGIDKTVFAMFTALFATLAVGYGISASYGFSTNACGAPPESPPSPAPRLSSAEEEKICEDYRLSTGRPCGR